MHEEQASIAHTVAETMTAWGGDSLLDAHKWTCRNVVAHTTLTLDSGPAQSTLRCHGAGGGIWGSHTQSVNPAWQRWPLACPRVAWSPAASSDGASVWGQRFQAGRGQDQL